MKRRIYCTIMLSGIGTLFLASSHTDLQSLVFASMIFTFFMVPLFCCPVHKPHLFRAGR